MSGNSNRQRQVGRRTAIRTFAGALTLGVGLGSVQTVSAEDQSNYAEIEFDDQQSGGATVRVARTLVEADGFITIHTWDLIAEQNGPDTICGVSGSLEPGEYFDVPVRLFHPRTGYSDAFGDQKRLEESQRLVAVPHRDMNHSGAFEFTEAPHTDVPFTNGPEARTDLPVDDAVNDVASVSVGRSEDEPDGERKPDRDR